MIRNPAMDGCAASRRNSARRDSPGRADEGLVPFASQGVQYLVLLLGVKERIWLRSGTSQSLSPAIRQTLPIGFLVIGAKRGESSIDEYKTPASRAPAVHPWDDAPEMASISVVACSGVKNSSFGGWPLARRYGVF